MSESFDSLVALFPQEALTEPEIIQLKEALSHPAVIKYLRILAQSVVLAPFYDTTDAQEATEEKVRLSFYQRGQMEVITVLVQIAQESITKEIS